MKKVTNSLYFYIIVLAVVMAFDIHISRRQHEEVVSYINAISKVCEHYKKRSHRSIAAHQAAAIKSEMLRGYVKQKLDRLRSNLDKASNEVVDYVEKVVSYATNKRTSRFENLEVKFPANHQQYKKTWEEKERTEAEKRYNLDGNGIHPEIFYFHHGLRFASQKIKDYIKDKDILDCGAFVGDSVLVLKDYTDKKIYCYEFYEPCIEKFRKIMKLNNIASGYELIPLALGESEKTVDAASLVDCEPVNSRTNLAKNVIHITTIDAEAAKRNFNVGFIKADVEGYGLKLIKGAINTIKKQRPVLSLAVYHNREELFETKPFLEQHLKDYVFEFHLQQFDEGDMNELILFCYPKELL